MNPVSETGGNGSVAWHFALSNVEINNIISGAPLVQDYTIALNDGHAGITTQNVSVAVGSAGADILSAGHAADVLIGAGGNDNFAFSSTSVGNEAIVDFTHGSDLLQISVAGCRFHRPWSGGQRSGRGDQRRLHRRDNERNDERRLHLRYHHSFVVLGCEWRVGATRFCLPICRM